VQFSPFFCYFFPLGSKYSPENFFLEHPRHTGYVLPLSAVKMTLVLLLYIECYLVLKSNENLVIEDRVVKSESVKIYRLRLRPQSNILTRYSNTRALIATVTIRLILKYRL
jgi:hypothetical protein